MKIFILCILLIYIYYKVKHQFWSRQPVFHYHNILYWLSPPGIINHEIPKRGKYFSYEIDFLKFKDMKKRQKNDFYQLILNHYLRNKYESYEPTRQSVLQYFEKHNDICTASLYYKNERLISSMTLRPLKFNDGYLYYVDFLCVDKNHRKEGVASKIIYTHYVRHREEHPNKIFLFKREGVLTSIVPLTTYSTYGFEMKKKYKIFHPEIKNEKITKKNINTLYHFLSKAGKKFIYFIIPNYSHLINLMSHGLLQIFIVTYKNEAIGCYIFRDSHTKYAGVDAIDLIASCYLKEKELFEKYLFDAIKQIKKKVLLIEGISDNHVIINNLLKSQKYIFKSSAAYFLYNYATHPIKPEKILIIN